MSIEPAPASLVGVARALEAAASGHAALLRRCLARADAGRAWAHFDRLRHLLTAHLAWESDTLPGAIGVPELIDLPAGVRTVRAWHDLLIDALFEVDALLSAPGARAPRSNVRAERAVVTLSALIEDYAADIARSVYRSLDEDVEAHDAETIRRRALDAWAHRTQPFDRIRNDVRSGAHA